MIVRKWIKNIFLNRKGVKFVSLNKIVKETLKPLNIPVEFQTYGGKSEPYITFFTYLNQAESYADDEEEVTGYYIQLDLFGKGNLEKLQIEIIKLLKSNGFIKKSINDGLYEPDTKFYHKVFRFFFYIQN